MSSADRWHTDGTWLAISGQHAVDRARVRAHDVMDLRGTHDRLTSATGWRPEIPFRQTMLDTLEWWEQQLGGAGSARAAQR